MLGMGCSPLDGPFACRMVFTAWSLRGGKGMQPVARDGSSPGHSFGWGAWVSRQVSVMVVLASSPCAPDGQMGAGREMGCSEGDEMLGSRWDTWREMGCWGGNGVLGGRQNARRETECSEGGGMLEGRPCIQRQTGCSEEDGARKEGGTWGKMGVLGGRQGARRSTECSEAAMSMF